MDSEIKYPIGEQSFEALRTNGFLYVDKSRFIETLLNSSRYYFLGRPRRFGKSLFLSMLKCFFEGKRHLFRGLYADGMDWDWCEYPVLYLDINIEKYKTPETLGQVLLNNLLRWEETYGITPQIDNLSIRFNNVIRAAYMKTGRQVVVLVDEYDKPLVNNLHDDAQFAMFRDMLASFYSNFKTCADYLKLVFLTGVSRFGKLSVFSDLNNIRDISFDNKFSDICGITETELIENLGAGIKGLSETYGTDERETIKNLRRNYDGYRFSANGKDIYNPFSILCAMERAEFGNYWIQSGQPTLLLEQLKKYNTDLATLFPAACDFDELSELDIYSRNPVPLLYQTGYLTIKSYDLSSRIAHLDIPNLEVKKGFLNFLLPYYADLQGESSSFFVSRFVKDLKDGKTEEL